MKYNHVFEIVWQYYGDDTESHRTLIEVSSSSFLAATDRFRKFYNKIHSNSLGRYDIVSVSRLGKVLKKCW